MKKSARSKDGNGDGSALKQYFGVLNTKQLFIGAALNLSWRLAFTVLVPIAIGISLDNKFNSSPSYTLTGFMLAIVAGCVAVWSTVKEVNILQANYDSSSKISRRRKLKETIKRGK